MRIFTYRRALLALMPVLLVPTACTADPATEARPHASTPARPGAAVGAGTPAAREGIFDVSRTNDARFRVVVDAVLRDTARTVLRVTVTNLESTGQLGIDRFGDSGSDYSFGGFKLLDPVGGRLYHGYRERGVDGLGFGSRLRGVTLQPGVHYSAVVYFPPLPATVTAVTVLSPGTTGEFTGVPVTNGSHTAKPAASDGAAAGQELMALNAPRPAGSVVELPAVEPAADAWSLAAAVYGPSAGVDRETLTSAEQRSVALRSDILFPFGKATLTAEAHTLIRSAAEDIAARAAPDQAITVVGHTDGIGSNTDNLALSQRRARSVVAALRTALGDDRRFTVTGKGETEPLAEERNADGSDNPAGRARNRRVEISYPPAATAVTPQPGAPASAAPPAAETPVVAERDGTSDSRSDSAGPVRFHLTVRPFHRDGDYLVAVFDLANTSGTKLDTHWGYFRSPTHPGPSYASFAVVDPATGTAYRTAYVTVDGVKRHLDGRPHSLTSAEPQRAYMYVPAPPAGVTAVTFDAGPFGKIENVPIR
ncbi:OmpA family protein [Micromonospora sp. NPDC047670]|uniref:OmpA family protein n=1 Tax=Micromonospora sp. NPDC047670 TaxID=3364252 RepID=UPI003713F76C